ncbi:Lipocalin-like domain-containing protein [Flaviramulus basaltis]|uniref:Lipocalin-like domain-containing protein n=1 Tax=Flaviramulus basaltis TaxID=369401 RepID=A0A1K2ICF0_9FLAO|nr:lipocalin family protein [Flaviramulus basaltis]SFZ89918.1 Lipocalin-like domain-containing protein [Flaviramulus basaltis]
MKRILLLLLTITIMSCGASKTVRDSKKVIKGDWTLTSIEYNQGGSYNSILFNDASSDCFEGSTWKFIPNNNTGIYTLNGMDCSLDQRHFIFTIQEIDATTGLYDFLLKPTDEKYNSETNQGFRLSLTALSETSMQWQQAVSVAGSSFTMSMNFIKK